jgi:hypothetical protein
MKSVNYLVMELSNEIVKALKKESSGRHVYATNRARTAVKKNRRSTKATARVGKGRPALILIGLVAL